MDLDCWDCFGREKETFSESCHTRIIYIVGIIFLDGETIHLLPVRINLVCGCKEFVIFKFYVSECLGLNCYMVCSDFR